MLFLFSLLPMLALVLIVVKKNIRRVKKYVTGLKQCVAHVVSCVITFAVYSIVFAIFYIPFCIFNIILCFLRWIKVPTGYHTFGLVVITYMILFSVVKFIFILTLPVE